MCTRTLLLATLAWRIAVAAPVIVAAEDAETPLVVARLGAGAFDSPRAAAIALGEDGRVAVACEDGKVRVFDADGQLLLALAGASKPATSVAFSRGGTLLASDAGAVYTFDARTGGTLFQISKTCSTMATSPD